MAENQEQLMSEAEVQGNSTAAMDDGNKDKLWQFVKDNYNDWDSQEQFEKDMSYDDTRKALFDDLKTKTTDWGDNMDQFDKDMGYGKYKSTTEPAVVTTTTPTETTDQNTFTDKETGVQMGYDEDGNPIVQDRTALQETPFQGYAKMNIEGMTPAEQEAYIKKMADQGYKPEQINDMSATTVSEPTDVSLRWNSLIAEANSISDMVQQGGEDKTYYKLPQNFRDKCKELGYNDDEALRSWWAMSDNDRVWYVKNQTDVIKNQLKELSPESNVEEEGEDYWNGKSILDLVRSQTDVDAFGELPSYEKFNATIRSSVMEHMQKEGNSSATYYVDNTGKKWWVTTMGYIVDSREESMRMNKIIASAVKELDRQDIWNELDESGLPEQLYSRAEERYQKELSDAYNDDKAITTTNPEQGQLNLMSTYIRTGSMSLNHATMDAMKTVREIQKAYVKALEHGNDWTEFKAFLSNAWAGFRDNIKKGSTWTSFYDLGKALNMKQLLDKYNNGEQLTGEEKDFLNAMAIEATVLQAFGDQVGYGYKSGQTTAQSIPFMLEMMFAGETGLIESFTKMAGKMVPKSLARGFTRMGLKYMSRGAVRVMNNTVGALGAGVPYTATFSGVGIAADYLKRTTGGVTHTDLGGHVDFDRLFYGFPKETKAEKALFKAFASAYLENTTEFLGDKLLEPIKDTAVKAFFKEFRKTFGKDISMRILHTGCGRYLAGFAAFQDNSVFKNALKATAKALHQNGLTVEYLEEVLNNVGSACIGDMEWKDVKSFNKNLETVLGLSWTCGGFAAGGAVSRVYQYNKGVAELNQYDRSFTNRCAGNENMLSAWNDFKASLVGADFKEAIESFKALQSNLTSNGADQEMVRAMSDDALKYLNKNVYMNGLAVTDAEVERYNKRDKTPAQIKAEDKIEDAKADGSLATTPEERQALAAQKEESTKQLGDLVPEGGNADEVVAQYGNTPSEQLQGIQESETLDDDQKARLEQYVQAKSRVDAVAETIEGDAKAQKEAQRKDIESKTNTTTGNMHAVTIDGEQGYVTLGDDDATKPNSTVMVRMQDGTIKQTTVGELVNGMGIEEYEAVNVNAQEELQRIYAEIDAQTEQQKQSDTTPPRLVSADQQVLAAGAKVYVGVGEDMLAGTIVSNGTESAKEGEQLAPTYKVQLDGQEKAYTIKPDVIFTAESVDAVNASQEAARQALAQDNGGVSLAQDNTVSEEEPATTEEAPAVTTEEAPAETVTAPQEKATEEQSAPAEEVIPTEDELGTHEDGNVRYESRPVAETAGRLSDLDEETQRAVVDASKEAAEKAKENAQKRIDKLAKPKFNGNITAYKEQVAKYNEEVSAAQQAKQNAEQRAKYWEDVEKTLSEPVQADAPAENTAATETPAEVASPERGNASTRTASEIVGESRKGNVLTTKEGSQLVNPEKLTADNVTRIAQETGVSERTVRRVEALAQKAGKQLYVANYIKGKGGVLLNGIFFGNDAVCISKDSLIHDTAIDFFAGHEFTHALARNNREFLNDFINKVYASMGANAFENEVNNKREVYSWLTFKSPSALLNPEQEQKLLDILYEEVAADYAGRMMQDPRMLARMIDTDMTFRERVAAALQDVIDFLRNFIDHDRMEAIEACRDLWAGEVNSKNESANWSRYLENTEGVEQQARTDATTAVAGTIEMEDGEHQERASVSSTFEGAGFEASTTSEEGEKIPLVDADGNVCIKYGDKVFNGNNPVTADDLKNVSISVLNYMMEDALKIGTITNEQAEGLYNKYAALINTYMYKGLAENGGVRAMTESWQWLGDTVYRSVAKNGDAQYGWSMDITKVCKKNEAVIKAISKLQAKLGYGITPGQIMDIYLETINQGYQVPCPVCYVFSRYINNGKFASAAINGMLKYGKHLPGQPAAWSVSDWEKELERLDEEKGKYGATVSKATAELKTLLWKIDNLSQEISKGQEKGTITQAEIDSKMAEIHELDARYKAALNVFAQQSLTNWIKCFVLQSTKGKNKIRKDAKLPADMEDFKRHALDLTLTSSAMVNYPAIQRLRRSGGSSSGKEITFASNNALGEIIGELATGTPETARNWYQEAVEAKTPKSRSAARAKARKRFKDAALYAQKQTLRGGQRMWSWSDNIIRLGGDVAMNLMQMEMLGGALQSYSKQLEGIKLVASMNGYVNGSLMGRGIGYVEVSADNVVKKDDGSMVTKEDITYHDENKNRDVVGTQAGSTVLDIDGKLYALSFDDVVGIQAHGETVNGVYKKGLFDLNNELDKAGNILVGMNDNHVRIAMADPRVFFIIPWHSSGASSHILAQMLKYLGVSLKNWNPVDYTDMQEEKDYGKATDGVFPQIPKRLTDLWNQWRNETDYRCGIKGGIPSGEGTLSKEQQHYRQLRDAIFDGTIDNKDKKAWKEEVMNDEFLSQAYNRVINVDDHKMTTKDKTYIYPYEYWDETSTYETADVNAPRYIEYARRLGYKPKFSGRWKEGKSNINEGNFLSDPGFWKLLIDRRMYDRNGNYQWLDPVSSEGFEGSLIDPSDIEKEFIVTQVADDEGAERIASNVQKQEAERIGGASTVNYNLSMAQAVNAFSKTKAPGKVDYEEDEVEDAGEERAMISEQEKQEIKERVKDWISEENWNIAVEASKETNDIFYRNIESLNNAKRKIEQEIVEVKKSVSDLNRKKHAPGGSVLSEDEENAIILAEKKKQLLRSQLDAINNKSKYANSKEAIDAKNWQTLTDVKTVFQDETEYAVAYVPEYIANEIGANDVRVHTGLAYMIDHAVNHHESTTPDEYKYMQDVLESPDDYGHLGKSASISFIKKINGAFYILTIRLLSDGSLQYVQFYRQPKVTQKLTSIKKQANSKVDLLDGAHGIDYSPIGTSNEVGRSLSARYANANVRQQSETAKQNGEKYSVGVQNSSNERSNTAYEDAAVRGEVDEQDERYSVYTGPAPKNTRIVYKLMRIDQDGNLHPLFIDRNDIVPIGVWLLADSPKLELLKTLPNGIHLVDVNDVNGQHMTLEEYCNRYRNGKQLKKPGKEDIKRAKEMGMRFMEIKPSAKGREAENIRKYGQPRQFYNYGLAAADEHPTVYALRTGWHAGSLPTMHQIANSEGLRNDDEVWVECEINYDNDFTEELGMKDVGEMRDNGSYKYTTNGVLRAKELSALKRGEQSDGKGVSWWLTTQLKVKRILSDAEADNIVLKHNAENGDNVEVDHRRKGQRQFNAETGRLESNQERYSASDQSYLDAVESGDMEAAERMVKERAKDAMPETKVVDEDGYPLVVYHGSPVSNITVFDKELAGRHTNAYHDEAVWVTNSEKTADVFSHEMLPGSTSYTVKLGEKGKVYPLYIDMKNPFIIGKLATDSKMMGKLMEMCNGSERTMESVLSSIGYGNEQLTKIYLDYDKLQELGYDGVIARMYATWQNNDAMEYGVFSPEQIKSAETITRDDAGNVIPLSERFNEENEDIRYSAQVPQNRLEGESITEWSNRVGNSFGVYSNLYLSGVSHTELHKEKLGELIAELKEKGFNARDEYSHTTFGDSAYLYVDGIKFRISDHNTGLRRAFEEHFIDFSTTSDDIINVVNEVREERIKLVNRRRAESDAYKEWEELATKAQNDIARRYEGRLWGDLPKTRMSDEEIENQGKTVVFSEPVNGNGLRHVVFIWGDDAHPKIERHAPTLEDAAKIAGIGGSYEYVKNVTREMYSAHVPERNDGESILDYASRVRDYAERYSAPANRSDERPGIPVRLPNESLDEYARRRWQAEKARRRWDRMHPGSLTDEDARKAVINEIKAQLNAEHVSEANKNDLLGMLRTLRDATAETLPTMLDEANRIVNHIEMRYYERRVDDLLGLKVKDVNGRNQNVARNVDDATRRIFESLQKIGTNQEIEKVQDQIHALRSQNWHLTYDEKQEQSEKERLQKIEENKQKIKDLNLELNRLFADDITAGSEGVAQQLAEQQEKESDPEQEWTEEDDIHKSRLLVQQKIYEAKDALKNINDQETLLRQLQESYDNLTDRMNDNVVSESGREALREQRALISQKIKGMRLIVNQAQASYIDALKGADEMLTDLYNGGRESLRNEMAAEREIRNTLLRGVMSDVTGTGKEYDQLTEKQQKESNTSPMWKTLFSPLNSFEYEASRVGHRTMGKDSFFYNWFVSGPNGIMAAGDKFVNGMRGVMETLNNKCREIYGVDFEHAWKNNASKKCTIQKTIEVKGTPIKVDVEMSLDTAMYLHMLWKQKDGQGKILNMGFSADSMDDIVTVIGGNNVEFAEWVQETFLKDLREPYNEVYKQIYHTSMADIEHYFPIKTDANKRKPDSGLEPTGAKNSTLQVKVGSTVNRTANVTGIDMSRGAFDVLFDHLNEVEEFMAFAPVRRDLNWVIGSTFIKNKMNANSRGSYKRLTDAAAVACRVKIEDVPDLDKLMSFIQRGLVGGNIAFRNTTAWKQTLSVPAYFGYSQDLKFWGKLAANIGLQYTENLPALLQNMATFGYRGKGLFNERLGSKKTLVGGLTKTIGWCMDNMPDFYDRVMKGTAGMVHMDKEGMKEVLGDFLAKAMEQGMRSNQMVDAITVAIGAKTMYDYRMSLFEDAAREEARKSGLTGEFADQFVQQYMQQNECHDRAVLEAEIYFNCTQQSNNPLFLSPFQTNRGFLHKMFSLYKNSPTGYARQLAESINDIGRAFDPKTRSNMIAEYAKRAYINEQAQQYLKNNPNATLSSALLKASRDFTETVNEQARQLADEEGVMFGDAMDKVIEDLTLKFMPEAKKQINKQTKKAAFNAFWYGLVMNHVWNLGGYGLLGMFTGVPIWALCMYAGGDAGDPYPTPSEELRYLMTLPANGVIGPDLLNNIIGAVASNDTRNMKVAESVLGAEVSKSLREFMKMADTNGWISPQMAWYLVGRAGRFAGLNPEILTNTYLGLERFIRDGWHDGDEAIIDLMLLLQSPESNRIAVAKNLFRDRPVSEYIHAVKRAAKYLDEDCPTDWEGFITGEKAMPAQKESDMYNYYARTHMTPAQREAADEREEKLKQVKKVATLEEAKKMYDGEKDTVVKNALASKITQLVNLATLPKKTPEEKLADVINKMVGVPVEKNSGKAAYQNARTANDVEADAKLAASMKALKKIYDEFKSYANDIDKSIEFMDNHIDELIAYKSALANKRLMYRIMKVMAMEGVDTSEYVNDIRDIRDDLIKQNYDKQVAEMQEQNEASLNDMANQFSDVLNSLEATEPIDEGDYYEGEE